MYSAFHGQVGRWGVVGKPEWQLPLLKHVAVRHATPADSTMKGTVKSP